MTLQALDPRARVIFYLCMTTMALLLRDPRALALLALFGTIVLIAAQVPWERLRPIVPGTAVFIVVISGLNLLTRTPVEALQQALRAITMMCTTLAIVLTFDTALLGITFRGLGLPDRFAYALDLTARFVPTLARDFRTTIDAQKARGYELQLRSRNLKDILSVGRRLVPLIVPVVVRAVLDAEDRANAMDLRGFGTQQRTWLQVLRYRFIDGVFIALSLGALAGCAWLRFGLGF